ncbi:MAG TPA: tetratricopeptide repeat protein [Burkholderiaceae bacterium]
MSSVTDPANRYRFVAAIEEELIDPNRDGSRLDARAPFLAGGSGRLAILPFHNQTGRPDLAWMDLGLMSMTIEALASMPGLSVVPAADLLAVVGAQNSSTDLETAAQKIAETLGASDLIQAVVKVDPQGATTLEYQGWGSRLATLKASLSGFDPIALCRQMAKDVQAHMSPSAGDGSAGASKEIVKDAQFVHVAHSRALHAIHIERWALARALLRVALDIVPDDIAIRLDYARCLAWQRDPQVAPLLEEALKQARSAHDPALEVRALHLYATFLHGAGRLDEAERLLSEALKIAEAQQDQETELQLLVSIGQTLANEGRTAVAAWMIDRAAQLAGALGNRVATARLLDVRGRVATIKGDDRAALAAFTDAANLSEQYGIFATASFSVTHVGHCLVNAGQMIAAADCFERAFRYACQSGSPVSVGLAGCAAVRFGGLWRGDVAHADGILDKMRQTHGTNGALVQASADFAQAFVSARHGRLEESCQLLEKAGAQLADSRSFSFHADRHRARTLVCLGRLDEAADLCTTIEKRVTGRLKRPATGAVLHCRGLIARAAGDDAEALSRFRACMAELPSSIDRTEAALDAAWLLLEAGEPEAARQVLSGLEDFMAAALTSEFGAAMLVKARLHFAEGHPGAAAELQRRYCDIMSCPPQSNAQRHAAAFERAAAGKPVGALPPARGLPSLFELVPGMELAATQDSSLAAAAR